MSTSSTTPTAPSPPPPPQSKKEGDNGKKDTTTKQSSTASPPTPQRQEEEPDVCCICLDELPTDVSKLCRYTCCGKTCCFECQKNVQKSTMPDELKNRCHQCRKPTPENDKEQIERLREWLDKGEAWAQSMMASWYRDGRFGLTQSYVMARMLFEKAVAQGDPYAMFDLALMYENGQGVKQSDERVAELYTMAAEQGHVKAMNNLGNRYRDGKGVVQSYTKAVELFTIAAEQGQVDAMCSLGVLYFQGQGVAQSNELARKWLTKAANEGYENAVNNLKILDEQEGKSSTTAPTTTASPLPICCSSCNTPQPSGHTFRKCMGCRTVQYCNKECQRAHWSPGGHKQECKRLRKKKEEKKKGSSSSQNKTSKST
jgi:TPR repeat protein